MTNLIHHHIWSWKLVCMQLMMTDMGLVPEILLKFVQYKLMQDSTAN